MFSKIEELIEGEIYTQNDFIFKYGLRIDGNVGYDYFIDSLTNNYYSLNNKAYSESNVRSVKIASFNDKIWLEQCIKLNKFIPKEEALKIINNIKNEENIVKKIKEILEKIYVDNELRKNVIPLFIGNPGLGKSIIIHEFAKEKGVGVVEMIGSTLMPHEISGIAIKF